MFIMICKCIYVTRLLKTNNRATLATPLTEETGADSHAAATDGQLEPSNNHGTPWAGLASAAGTSHTQELGKLQRKRKRPTTFSIRRRVTMSEADLSVSKNAAAANGEPERRNTHGKSLGDFALMSGFGYTQTPIRSLRKKYQRENFSIRGRASMTEADQSVSKR